MYVTEFIQKGHVARMGGTRNAYNVLEGKFERGKNVGAVRRLLLKRVLKEQVVRLCVLVSTGSQFGQLNTRFNRYFL
jgi:hypothetical protein